MLLSPIEIPTRQQFWGGETRWRGLFNIMESFRRLQAISIAFAKS